MKLQVPWRIREAARILFAPSVPGSSARTGTSCPVCRTQDVAFLPLPSYFEDMLDRHGFIHSVYLTETLNRRQYACRSCGASDRERLYALYFSDFMQAGGILRDILDIAPAQPLRAFLMRNGAVGYRSVDMMMEGVDDRLDIQDMRVYSDGQFRIFICSHVLEHVQDDVAAMRELYRVLAPGGWGICMVPINLGLSEVYENSNFVSEDERWKHFGQHDHVRLYSKAGFVARLQAAGFRVEQLGAEHFGADRFALHGIHRRSVLYIGHKDSDRAPASGSS